MMQLKVLVDGKALRVKVAMPVVKHEIVLQPSRR